MSISNQTVLKKMSTEIQEAMLQHENDQKVKEHVRSVLLLAELFLEKGESSSRQEAVSNSEPTADEIRKMMGSHKSEESSKDKYEDDEDANGASIFDF